MRVDDKLIDKLSKLSSLEIDDKKRDILKNDLTEIINFVDVLNSVDVSNIDATFNTLDGGTTLRKDLINQEPYMSEDIIKNSSKSEEGYFIVPKILE